MPFVDEGIREDVRGIICDSASSGAPLFDVEWDTEIEWDGGELVIDEVLYFFDEPLMFTVKVGPFILLLQRWSDKDGARLHTVSVVDAGILRDLRENRLSVRGAVAGDLRYMVDLDGTSVKRAWAVRRWNIASARLPAPGTCLSDYHARGADNVLRVERKPAGAGLFGVSTFECRQPGFDLAMCPTPAAVDALARFVDLLRRAWNRSASRRKNGTSHPSGCRGALRPGAGD